MILNYLPDGRTETSRFFPHLCDEHPFSAGERVEAIVAHGAALGLADRAEFAANSTYWSVARAVAWLDGFRDDGGGVDRTSARPAASASTDSDLEAMVRRARVR